MKDKILIIALIGLPVLMIIGGVVFFLIQDDNQPSQEDLDTTGEQASQQQVRDESPKPEVVVEERVVAPVLSFDETKIWFFGTDGMLFRKGMDDLEKEAKSGFERISNIQTVVWEVDGPDFLIEQNTSGHTSYAFYDGDDEKYIAYPDSLKNPSFMHDGQHIIYKWINSDGFADLKIAEKDGSDFQTVTRLFRTDYEIVPSTAENKAVVFANSQDDPSGLYLVDLRTGSFSELSGSGVYQGVKFSPDGDKILVAKKDLQGTGSVFVMLDLFTKKASEIDLSAEIEQVAWTSDSSAVVAVNGRGISSYSLLTEKSERLTEFPADTDFDPVDVFTNKDGNIIYFVDSSTGYLYRVKL